MLVLTRKINESVQIGENVRVIISRIDGDKVKLVFDAPKEIAIYRTEVLEKKD